MIYLVLQKWREPLKTMYRAKVTGMLLSEGPLKQTLTLTEEPLTQTEEPLFQMGQDQTKMVQLQ